ncbi:MAG: hypothetical protein ACFFCO_03095 [Promethearchaeota archaeon]
MTQVRDVGGVLFIGNHRIQPLVKISAAQAMGITCFGSLAFCCDLSRECRLRDDALQLLGMSKEEYSSIQQECHQRFLHSAERRWPHEIMIRPAPQPTYQSPAVASGERRIEPGPVLPAQITRQERGSPHATSHHRSKTVDTIVDLGGLFESSHTGYKPLSERPSTTRDETLPQSPFTTKRRYTREERGYVHPSSSAPTSMTPSSSHRFCVYCGQDLRDDSDFCSRCRRSQK